MRQMLNLILGFSLVAGSLACSSSSTTGGTDAGGSGACGANVGSCSWETNNCEESAFATGAAGDAAAAKTACEASGGGSKPKGVWSASACPAAAHGTVGGCQYVVTGTSCTTIWYGVVAGDTSTLAQAKADCTTKAGTFVAP